MHSSIVVELIAGGWKLEGGAAVAPDGTLRLAVAELAPERAGALLAAAQGRLARIAAAAQSCRQGELAGTYRDAESLVRALRKVAVR